MSSKLRNLGPSTIAGSTENGVQRTIGLTEVPFLSVNYEGEEKESSAISSTTSSETDAATASKAPTTNVPTFLLGQVGGKTVDGFLVSSSFRGGDSTITSSATEGYKIILRNQFERFRCAQKKAPRVAYWILL